MSLSSLKHVTYGLVLAIALGVTAGQARGEIAVTADREPGDAIPAAAAKEPMKGSLKLGAPLWLQCWQYGVKIIDEKNLFSVRLQNLIERDSLGFRRNASNDADIYVIPVNGDSTCLVKPLR